MRCRTKCFLCLHFPKITRPSFPNRRVHSQIRSPCSFGGPLLCVPRVPCLVVSRHFAGFLLADPVRTFSAAHDPGVHRRFTGVRRPRDPRDAFSALRSFPSADSRCAPNTALTSFDVRCSCVEALTSCPTVTLLCCAPQCALKPAYPFVPKDH